MASKSMSIDVETLARVEGEGALLLRLKGSKVVEVKLRIYEPPRFFEAFLRGRSWNEAPDITARICGICPVAYQMSSVHAMEDVAGVKVTGQLRELRRLLYCGEWIESHALHIFMLHAPDFLGYDDVIGMAADHPELVQRALAVKKTGNDIVNLVGGREIHPINVRIGGFYRTPTRGELEPLRERLLRARDEAVDFVKFVATLPMQELEFDYEFVALRHPGEYPFNEGNIVSSKGIDIAVRDFETVFQEQHVAHSNALHSTIRDRGNYHTGPLARYSLNFDRLSPIAQQAALEAGLGPICRNPFQSIVVRAVELLYACDEALRIIGQYERPERPFVEMQPKVGIGAGCTEAPRGILYHRYRIDELGKIMEAKIVPPTAQNLPTIEDDVRRFAESHLDLGQAEMTLRCEQTIRNYDPCISCATHFLKLEIERE
ncbi:MAG: Ni/Fe hydrogenase subunit alpha [Thermoanaerobaculia bacterium]|jgi:coenzyme F420-reducing hydrogenase alpha subunit